MAFDLDAIPTWGLWGNLRDVLSDGDNASWVDADSSDADVQAALDAGGATLMEDVSVSATLDLDVDYTCLNLNGFQLTSASDPVLNLEAHQIAVMGPGRIIASAGHCYQATDLSNSRISQVHVTMQNAAKSVWNQSGTDQAFDVILDGGHWELSGSNSAPALNVVVSGALFAANVIAPKRITHSGGSISAPSIYLESTGSGSFLYDNVVGPINFETPVAGAIHAYSVQALKVRDVTVWDAHLQTITDHMIWITKDTVNADLSAGVLIDGYHRISGTIGDNYDIKATEGFEIRTGGMCVLHPMGSTAVTLQLDVEAGSVIGGYNVTEN